MTIRSFIRLCAGVAAFCCMLAGAPMHSAYAAQTLVLPMPEGTCSAEGLFGGECQISCPGSTTPFCKGGLFSASCKCIRSLTFTSAGISSQQLDDAEDYSTYLGSLGTTEASDLAVLVDACVSAAGLQDDVAYSRAENAFADAYETVSTGLRGLTTTWRAGRGYGQ